MKILAAPAETTKPSKEEVIPYDVFMRLNPVIVKTFSENDFHCVDMKSIAAAASMSFSTIYKHFGNKEKLLFWFIAQWVAELNTQAIAAMRGEKSLKEKLYERLKVHLNFYERNPDIGRIIFMTVPLATWMKDESYASTQPMKVLLSEIRRGQESGELRTDVDSTVILDAYSGTFNRAFLMWEYRKRTYSLSSKLDAIFQVLWDGIRSHNKEKS
jgi:AcrR family transcriptional regulator